MLVTLTLVSGILAGTARVPMAPPDALPLWVYDVPEALPKGEVYDRNLFAVTLQGIVNRDDARLYLLWFAPEPGMRGVDREWLDILRGPGGWLAERPLRSLSTFDELVSTARTEWGLGRCVVWDPGVQATANVATTLAGVLNAPVASPDLARSLGLDVELDLREAIDYAAYRERDPALFADDCFGRNRAAYQWLLETYGDRISHDRAGYLLDGLGRDGPGWTVGLGQRDLLVAERAMVFDLSPWERTDPEDKAMLDRILDTLGGRVEIVGLFPWPVKYSGHSGWWRKWDRYERWRDWNPPGVEAPAGLEHNLDHYQMAPWTEWEFIHVISTRSSYLNPAHWGCYSGNVSFHRHAPLPDEGFPQPPPPSRQELEAQGFLTADGGVIPRHYVMFIVGDMDNFGWVRHYMRPSMFWAEEFRDTPFNWDLNPSDVEHIPDILGYLHATRHATDWFLSPQTGIGYLFPTSLPNPTELSWFAHTSKWRFQVLDYKAMFAFDRFEPTPEVLRTLADIAPDGVHWVIDHSPFGATWLEHGLREDSTGRATAPVLNAVRPTQVLDFGDPAGSARATVERGEAAGEGGLSFLSYWVQTTSISDREFFRKLLAEYARIGSVAVVDHRTFASLFRLAHGGSNDNRATFVGLPQVLQVPRTRRLELRVQVRNDGWNSWRPGCAIAVDLLTMDGETVCELNTAKVQVAISPREVFSESLTLDLDGVSLGGHLLRLRVQGRPGELPFPTGDMHLMRLMPGQAQDLSRKLP